MEAIGAVGANLRPFPSTDPSVASLETPEKTGYIAKKKKTAIDRPMDLTGETLHTV